MTHCHALRLARLAPALAATTFLACTPSSPSSQSSDKTRDPAAASCSTAGQAHLSEVVTSLSFDARALSDLRVTVQDRGATKPAPQHALAVLPGATASYAAASECMTVEVSDGHLRSFTGGTVAHRGGPTLTQSGASLSLVGFQVRVGAEPRTFDILDASGEVVLRGALPHYVLDSATGMLDVFNVDLRATETLAARWGVPHLAGYVIGTLSMRGKVVAPAAALRLAQKPDGEAPQNACDDFTGNVDVALIGMDDVQQRARLGDKVVITPSATLKNVGTANVPWQAKFSGVFPPYNTDQHPFLVWALYRESGGVFEMLAQSDVKHAFLTINSNCAPGSCTVSSVLGLGCEDVYGVSTNGNHLAPRSEILPHAGTWAHCNVPAPNTPSHFDQAAPWCQQDNNGSTEGVLEHRAVASDAELGVAGANYYLHAWYVVRDDINIFNSMGWRRVVPTLSGTTWSFALATPFRQGSALDAWVDPAAPTPTRLNVTAKDPSAGAVQLAVTATDLGNGKYRYVYVLQNHDYDPKLSSVTVPMTEGATIEQPKYSDGDDDLGNNWLLTPGIGQVSWTAPTTTSRLAWGTSITFMFTSNVPPARSAVRVTRSDNGASFTIKSLTPGTGAFSAGT